MTENKLKLDDELVRQLLSEDNVTAADDTNQDIMLERIKNHFDFEITDSWNKNPDMMFYTETTSDGYEVWIATDDDRHPSINEYVYYYESDWLEKMEDAMTDGMTVSQSRSRHPLVFQLVLVFCHCSILHTYCVQLLETHSCHH